MKSISFKRHRFQPEIIRHAIWLRTRLTLGIRDVDEKPAEPGLDIDAVINGRPRDCNPI
jgi:putative transposase